MPTIEATYLAPAGLQAATLTSFAGDDIWPIVPAAGMQLVGADALTIGADGVVTGADGTYSLTLIDPDGDGTAYTESYIIGEIESAPILSNPTGIATSDTTADVSVSTDEDNGTLYLLVSSGATAITSDVISLGISQAVTAIGTQSATITDLSAESTYYVHFVHVDAAGNESDVASSTSFTTDVASTEPTGGDVTTTATYQAPTGWQVITLPEGYDNYIFNHAEGTQFEFVTTDKTGWQFGIEADPTKVELVLSGTDIELRIIGVDDGTGTLVKPTGIDLLNAVFVDPAGDGTAHGFDINTSDIAIYEDDGTEEPIEDGLPSGTFTIGTITTGENTATIPFTYSDNDADTFEYYYNSTWITTTSPIELTGLTSYTTYSLTIRARNTEGTGGDVTTTFTTDVEYTTPQSALQREFIIPCSITNTPTNQTLLFYQGDRLQITAQPDFDATGYNFRMKFASSNWEIYTNTGADMPDAAILNSGVSMTLGKETKKWQLVVEDNTESVVVAEGNCNVRPRIKML